MRTRHKFKSFRKAKPGKLGTHLKVLCLHMQTLRKPLDMQIGNTFKSAMHAYANFAKTSGHVNVLLSKTKRCALIN